MSQDAKWFYRDGLPDPEIPIQTGKLEKIPVYAHPVNRSDMESMLLPIHEACLDLIRRMCRVRQEQNQDPSVDRPTTLSAFCDALRQRKVKNDMDPDVSHSVDRYYANSGGIEWSHDYYGARQFWTDEWDTEPGWEVGEVVWAHGQRRSKSADAIQLLVSMRRPFAAEDTQSFLLSSRHLA